MFARGLVSAMLRHYTFLCLSSCALTAAAQNGAYLFCTIAGASGLNGSVDGTNSIARFNSPGGLAMDSAGTLYVCDILNHTIRSVSQSGSNWIVQTLAGQAGVPGSADGTNEQAQFDRPNGITVDPSGNLFVTDHYNHTIRELTPSGTNWIVKTIAGVAGVHGSADGTNSDARFWSPTGITISQDGHLFVTDTANFTVRELKPSGTNWIVQTIAGTPLNYGFMDGTNADAQFDYPYGVAADRLGRIFVSDWGNHAVRMLQLLGTNWAVTTIAGNSGIMGTNDGPGAVANFNFPNNICADAFGNLYVADQSNDTLRRLSPSGASWEVSTVGGLALQAGNSDGLGQTARFRHPWGVCADLKGGLFVSDYGNQTIREGTFLPALRVSLVAQKLVLSWPTGPGFYQAQSSTTPETGGNWLPLTSAPIANGQSLFLVVDPSVPVMFYRLQRR